MTATPVTPLQRKDFESDQQIRWCPGCGDYAILKAVQTVFPTLGIPKEKFVIVSGIGCSSRFPYYMSTYGFHTLHGRAPAVATGLKLARPDLEVWVVTGDGDALSIGGNHFIHTLRRNVGLKVLLFNNRIYGLTKGQYSPTSEVGKKTSSSPYGSLDAPFNPLALALGAGASFVARSVDIFQQHLAETLTRAAQHKGTAFVEIYQNCNIFNDGAFSYMTEKGSRESQVIYLENGKPLLFGPQNARRGVVLDGMRPKVVEIGETARVEDCIVWDESNPMLSAILAQLTPPAYPTPIGVFRSDSRTVFEQAVAQQIQQEIDKKGSGSLEKLLYSGDIWTVAG